MNSRARCGSSFDLVASVQHVAGQRTLRVLRRLTMNKRGRSGTGNSIIIMCICIRAPIQSKKPRTFRYEIFMSSHTLHMCQSLKLIEFMSPNAEAAAGFLEASERESLRQNTICPIPTALRQQFTSSRQFSTPQQPLQQQTLRNQIACKCCCAFT
jgi:hypothetical protein